MAAVRVAAAARMAMSFTALASLAAVLAAAAPAATLTAATALLAITTLAFAAAAVATSAALAAVVIVVLSEQCDGTHPRLGHLLERGWRSGCQRDPRGQQGGDGRGDEHRGGHGEQAVHDEILAVTGDGNDWSVPSGSQPYLGGMLFQIMNGPAREKFRDPGLVDFGGPPGAGRRLELLGGVLVDRPLPHASGPRLLPEAWPRAGAVFGVAVPAAGGRAAGRWRTPGPLPDPWLAHVPVGPATLSLEVRPAPSGQVGLFLEQVEQWRWLAATAPSGVVLSLFGHSGAATLALAAAGAEVVHVDASRQAVALARRNAAASGLDHLPIRWVCEDAATFVARELRRGRRFSGAVLDPPSWGHGPRGQAFAIDRDLAPLVADVARLLEPSGGPVLLTSHSPGWRHDRLEATLRDGLRAAGLHGGTADCGALECTDESSRPLRLGDYARWLPSR